MDIFDNSIPAWGQKNSLQKIHKNVSANLITMEIFLAHGIKNSLL